MAVSRFIDIFEAYDRFANGKRVTEQQWDYEIIPRRAKMLKESYDLFFGHEIIPTDDEMCDRLFMAGMDMLLSCGIYCTDLGKALTIEEEEIYQGLKMAPKKLTLGTGKDKCTLKPRRGNSFRKPIVEGGPTGAPISENIFEKVIATYAQEPMVDGIVSGVINTINGRSVVTDSPWEIKATMSEIRHIREAVSMAGRPGMSI